MPDVSPCLSQGHLKFAREHLDDPEEDWENVIWSDETKDQRGRCVATYPHHLGVACQEVQDPVAREVFSPRILSFVMSFEGTMVLNAELKSMNSILT